MSPERSSSRSAGASSKPYSRGVPYSTHSPDGSQNLAQFEHPLDIDMSDLEGKLGFPTRAQYQIIEQGYIASLTPRRQGKALISQALFDRIWDVLHSNDNTKENAQFRFWARKMFTLSKSHVTALGINESQPMGQEVLLHDGLLVAVREQIYDLLCYCHGSTNHGGRDKTCALVRKHYTWVPKDLVAQFIKACPTCIVKKCGHSEFGLLSPRLTAGSDSSIYPTPARIPPFEEKTDPTTPAFRDYFSELECRESHSQDSFSLPGTPVNTLHSQFIFGSEHLNGTPLDQLRYYNQISPNHSSTLAGFPMMREVSLYEGLPDGWQYRHTSYRNAHAECVDYQRVAQIMPYDPSLGRTRPRVPSIAPLFGSDFEDMMKAEDTEVMISQEELGQTLLPRAEGSGARSISPALSYPVQDSTMGCSGSPIDPFLLALSTPMQSPSEGSPISTRVALGTILNDTEVIRRPSDAGVSGHNTNSFTQRLKLEDLDSARTLHDFLSIRENLKPGFMTSGNASDPGRNNMRGSRRGYGSAFSSPTSSMRSAASGLSLIAAARSENSTPTTTAPVTLVDEEQDKVGIVDARGYEQAAGGRIDLGVVTQAVSACEVHI